MFTLNDAHDTLLFWSRLKNRQVAGREGRLVFLHTSGARATDSTSSLNSSGTAGLADEILIDPKAQIEVLCNIFSLAMMPHWLPEGCCVDNDFECYRRPCLISRLPRQSELALARCRLQEPAS